MDQQAKAYNCDVCTASCTFEAMCWCPLTAKFCPTIEALANGTVSDNGGFEFSYAATATAQSGEVRQ